MRCLVHEDYERSVRPANGCLRCWAVWFEEQGRLEQPLHPGDLAHFLRDLLQIVDSEYAQYLVKTPTR